MNQTATATADDPAFALIRAHDKVGRVYEDPDDVLGEETIGDLADQLDELTEGLANCQPTTVAGCVAVLRYVSQYPEGDHWPDPDWHDWLRRLHANVAEALDPDRENVVRIFQKFCYPG